MINFDEGNLAAGTLVIDQFEGLEISTPSQFGTMIFDTNNPTGDDYDLATEDLGNVLIISEDGDSGDPDDDAAGGTIKIEFDEPSTVDSIGLLDIEESGGFVEFFDAESNLIDGLEIEPFENGRSFELYPITSGISYIELNLPGSGALTSIDFSSGEPTDDASPIQLTEIGWERNGQQLGIWTNNSELVESSSAIEVSEGIVVNTLGGDDVVDSLANSGIGLLNQGTIITGGGNDLLQATLAGNGNDFVGIVNDIGAVIDTGEGEDRIISTIEAENNSNGHAGISLDIQSSIDTGAGNDTITGIIKAGVDGKFDGNFHDGINTTISSKIATGEGDDTITGMVEVGRDGDANTGFNNNNFTETDTGAGDDLITGTVTVVGDGDDNLGFVNGEASTFTRDGDDQIIGTVKVGGDGSFNVGVFAGLGGINLEAGDDYLYGAVEVAGDGENNFGIENFNNFIRMGAGEDRIVGKGTDAYSGFNGTYDLVGLIDLGEGDDTIEGFGREVVEGGSGMDTAKFEFNLDDSVTFGSSDSTSIDITANEKTMSFTNVEEFMFAGESFTLDELIELV